MNNPDLYFYKDKIHLKKEGKVLYSQLLVDAINPYLPDDMKCNPEIIPTLYTD